MSKYPLALMVGLSAIGLASADNKTELKALAGKWAVSDAEIDGKKVTETFKDLLLTIENGSYTVKIDTMEDKGTVSVDTSRKPKTMDVSGTEGVNRGKTFPCIYDLKDDTLTICYGLDFKTRPNEMKTSEKSNRLLIVYKRKK